MTVDEEALALWALGADGRAVKVCKITSLSSNVTYNFTIRLLILCLLPRLT